MGEKPHVLHTHCRLAYGSVLCAAGRWSEAESLLLDALGPSDHPDLCHRALTVAHLAESSPRSGSRRGGSRAARCRSRTRSPAVHRWPASTSAAVRQISPRRCSSADCSELVGDRVRTGSAADAARRGRVAARRRRCCRAAAERARRDRCSMPTSIRCASEAARRRRAGACCARGSTGGDGQPSPRPRRTSLTTAPVPAGPRAPRAGVSPGRAGDEPGALSEARAALGLLRAARRVDCAGSGRGVAARARRHRAISAPGQAASSRRC